MSKYDALDVAEYVIKYCEDELKKPITNFQLQNFLYYIQGYYLKKNNKPLFDNEIEAWDYGPVIPNAYYRYNYFIGRPIINTIPLEPNLLKKDEIELINKVIKEKIDMDVWALAKDTQNELPWKRNFNQGYKNEIPIEDMMKWFCEGRAIWEK